MRLATYDEPFAENHLMFLDNKPHFEMPFDPDEKDRRFAAKGD